MSEKMSRKAGSTSGGKIKSVIFDLGGVVMFGGYLDFVHHYIGKHLSKEAKQRILFLEHEVNLGKITETEFYRHIQKEFDVHLTPKQMHQKITTKMKTNKSLVKYIPQLKKAKVVLFSNSLGHMAAEMVKRSRPSIKRLFNRVFYSEVMHLAKPAQESYRYVVRKLKVKPHQALMVDDRKENIDAAKKTGLQGITFRNVPQFKREMRKYELV